MNNTDNTEHGLFVPELYPFPIPFLLCVFVQQFCHCSFFWGGLSRNHINSHLLCHLQTTGANCFGLNTHRCGLPQLILSFRPDDPSIYFPLLSHAVKHNSQANALVKEPAAEHATGVLTCCSKRKYDKGSEGKMCR